MSGAVQEIGSVRTRDRAYEHVGMDMFVDVIERRRSERGPGRIYMS